MATQCYMPFYSVKLLNYKKMTTIHNSIEKVFKKEKVFEIFKHNDLLCCIQRIGWAGNLNGYVAVPENHPFYEKDYNEHVVVGNIDEVEFNGNYIGLLCHSLTAQNTNMLSLSLAINVHGGLTYSDKDLCGIDENVFGKLWWFGFDTMHAGDLKPYQDDIDRQFPHSQDEYRDFEFVKNEVKSLAKQLSKYGVL